MPALFIAIGAPFASILLDRWGRKPVIVAALILYGLPGTFGEVGGMSLLLVVLFAATAAKQSTETSAKDRAISVE